MIKTFAELLESHCRAVVGARPLSDDAVRAQLVELPDWESSGDEHGKRIRRSYRFANYWEVIAFVNAIAFVIHREDHHPELVVGYDRLEVRFDTHSVGGISANDFVCAAKCDAAYAERPRAPEAPA